MLGQLLLDVLFTLCEVPLGGGDVRVTQVRLNGDQRLICTTGGRLGRQRQASGIAVARSPCCTAASFCAPTRWPRSRPLRNLIWDTAGEESQGDAAVSRARLKTLSPGEVQDMATNGVFLCTGHVPSTQRTRSGCGLRAM